MTEESIAQRAFERAQRGLEAWRQGAVGKDPGGGWVVAGEGIHRVDPQRETCTCPDYRRYRQPCKHLFAVAAAAAKTSKCSGCGELVPRRELTELNEDNHDDLTYFHGDRLCGKCADDAGVER